MTATANRYAITPAVVLQVYISEIEYTHDGFSTIKHLNVYLAVS